MNIEADRQRQALETVQSRLLAEMHPEGYWEGSLSSSALSTATALSALLTAGEAEDGPAIQQGLGWLAKTQNQDGGWGDTADSPSNLSTTLLSLCTLTLAKNAEATLNRARGYIQAWAGNTGEELVRAVTRRYGKDRTFATPILMNCALAGLVAWEQVPPLPYPLAALPHGFYKALRLQVVSYALPALIAIGLVVDHRQTGLPVRRVLRALVEKRVLEKLERIQPESGGFLEATPLTSFVAMALVPIRGTGFPVVARALSFLRAAQRADGSWPIDTNLSVWVTSSAVSALSTGEPDAAIDLEKPKNWLRKQQYTRVHPYTNAGAGGWGWTHLSGGVPDADDTAGAILALSRPGDTGPAAAGVDWLLDLQNRDGGWPTFCQGWGKLPFDQSAADLTAHVLRALQRADPERHNRRGQAAKRRGLAYLERGQGPDGAWVPLWFGNQGHSEQANPVLGTARVLRAFEALPQHTDHATRGVAYLVGAQNEDGGWGGERGLPSSMEETALAVSALAGWPAEPGARAALAKGGAFLVEGVAGGRLDRPAPIGLYFASLWYSERLYPIIWTREALGRLQSVIRAATSG